MFICYGFPAGPTEETVFIVSIDANGNCIAYFHDDVFVWRSSDMCPALHVKMYGSDDDKSSTFVGSRVISHGLLRS